MAVAVQLMGPVTLLRDGEPVEAGGPKQRTILGVLALSAGRRVSTERLVDVVWADDPPASARRTVQSYVAALRRTLGADAPLVSSRGGYVLEISHHAVDLLAFEDTVVAALGEVETDPAAAATALAVALDEWDVPLDGLREGSRLDELATPFEELQLQGVEGLAAAQIASSQAVDAVRMLEGLVRQHPTREQMWLLLARALAASGRRDAALTAIHRAREALREHLGVDLSSALSAFEIDLLNGGRNGLDGAIPQDGAAAAHPTSQVVKSSTDASGSGIVGGVVVRPSGTVTFLFTDVEGSTRRWEADSELMRVELAAHDDVLRTAIEGHGGWLFKHTGDGVCAAFASAQAGVDAAVDAQRLLGLSVRMGLTTGEAEPRGEDYFGPTLNRAARVMAAAHGGQILLSSSTAGLVSGVDLHDLGEHRLRDLSSLEHLFQVRADGLASGFPRLRTVDAVPGNLTAQATSFVGRDFEVTELSELVMQHRLVTLTGVGGVGKTRLAVQVAAELVPEFVDGVWLVELAPVGEPASVPHAVASALGVRPQAGRSVTESVAEALAGRRLLVVLDNCEHVVDAAAAVAEAIVRSSTTVSVIATSREGLRVGGERVWAVPTLDVSDGASSVAVELFTDRARSVVDGFDLDNDADEEAVTEICRRLDGVALGIELAAARMVSMSPAEVLERLDDRFRLLSGSRRAPERHQTLRQAVQWSYDLLTTDEQTVLGVCAVFAGGFDLTAVTAVSARFDEYEILDVVDSLVRKSLVTTSRVDGRTRYRLLETIRQFAEDHVADDGGGNAAAGELGDIRDRHARHFAAQVVAHWEIWEGPGQRHATDWLAVEFDNLRAGYRWAIARDDVTTATAIAAHSMAIAFNLQRFEPVAWAEEVLPAAADAEVTHLPRLYLAASFCQFAGRSPDALRYVEAASALQADPQYEPFDVGWTRHREALIHLIDGRADRYVEICTDLAAKTGLARVFGLCGLAYGLPLVGRAEEAAAIADNAIAAASAHASPVRIAFAHLAAGRAFTEADPIRALDVLQRGLTYTREQRIPHFEALIASEAAGLEAAHGDPERAVALFAGTIDSFHRAGDTVNLTGTLQRLIVFFDRIDQPEVAATIHGMTMNHHFANQIAGGATAEAHLRHVLDADTFDDCVRSGAAMNMYEAVRYANNHVKTAFEHQP